MNMDMTEDSAEYADYHVQNIGVRLVAEDEFQSGVVEPVLEFNVVSDRGIDSDELAELIGWKRTAVTRFQLTSENGQSTTGDLFFEGDFGVNLTESEAVGSSTGDPGNPTTIDTEDELKATVNEGDFNARVSYSNEEEPGQLDYFGLYGSPGSSEGAGPDTHTKEVSVFYPDKFGTGPFVDRTDDLVLLPELEFNDVVSRIDSEVIYQLYWDIHEMPEGRASFARP